MKLSETQMMAIQAAEQIVAGLFAEAGRAVERRDRISREIEASFGLPEGALQSTHGLDMQQGIVIERPKPIEEPTAEPVESAVADWLEPEAQTQWEIGMRSDPPPSSVSEAAG